uniref:Uncharacterized protein n=1 Tax=Lutzomyia longipalpis TaxID=7200 RepID=A0A1B0C8Y7_LUTLO
SLLNVFLPIQVTTSPKVHAAVQNGKIYVAVDQILVLLENENVGECKFLSFPETQIDCVFISDSGKLVVCCLANGTINGFCITGRPLFNLKIEEEDIGEEKTFVGISADGPDLYIMCRNGRLYKVGSVDEDKSMSLIENNETLVFDESITSNAQISRISSRKFYNEVISFIMIPCDDAPMAVCCDTTRIYVYSDGDFLPISLQEEQHGGIKKLHLIRNYLLGLCHNGSIVEICPYTGMVYNMSTEADCRIDDMVLMESTDEKIELMILTKPTSIGEKFLKIVDFPSMASLYDLDMSKHIWLVDQPKSPMGMYYLIGDGESTVPQEIEMKIISETLPQHQLMKMISRGRLEEVEEFAVQFNLSLEPIHEHRLKRHITKMAQCRNTEVLRVEFRDFLQLLDKINNVGKVLAMWDIGIPNRELTAEYLEYLMGKLSAENEAEREVMSKIAEHLRRIETLNLIDSAECILEWRNFLNSQNLLKICLGYLSSNIPNACLIWSRHSSHLVPNLDAANLTKILNSITNTTEPLSVIQWLHHFTPTLLQIHPEFMPIIVDWSIMKIRFFESSHAWRANSLEICNGILEIFTNLHFVIVDRRRQYDRSIRKLLSIKFALEDLQILRNDFNLTIGLGEYLTNSLEETTSKLLLNVQTDYIQGFINDFLYPKFIEDNKSPIECLVKYINLLVVHKKSFSCWQERAVIILELIPNEEERLIGAQNILQEAPVPWSPVLMPLIKYSALNHPIAQEIRSIYEQQIVKIIKLKYHWPQNSPDDFLRLICRILKEKTQDLWTDIKSLIKAVPKIQRIAYFCCIHDFSRHGNFEMAIHILGELENDRFETIDYLMGTLINILEVGDVEEKYEKNLIEMLNILDHKSNGSMSDRVQQINRIQTLKNRFAGQFGSINFNRVPKEEIFAKTMDVIVNNLRNYDGNIIRRLWDDVKILTEALKMDFLTGMMRICQKCCNLQLTCAIGYNILSMEDFKSYDCDKILQFCTLLLTQQMQIFDTDDAIIEDPLAFAIIYKFLVRVLQLTKIHYVEAKEMIEWVRIINELYPESALDAHYEGMEEKLGREIVEDFIQGHAKAKSKKAEKSRVSMSVFDCVATPTKKGIKEMKIEFQCTIKCLSTVMQILAEHPEGAAFGQRLKEFSVSHEENSLENGDSFSTDKMAKLKSDLSSHIHKLFELKLYYVLYTICSRIIIMQQKCGIEILPKNSLLIFQQKMMKSSLSEREFNAIESLGQLVSCDTPIKLIQHLNIAGKTDIFKVNYYSLTENYYNLRGEAKKAQQERENRIKYQFIMEIRKKNPDFELDVNLENLSLGDLVSKSCTVPIDVGTLQKLFSDFSWKGDYQELLIFQLILVLKQQELKFSVTTDAFGKENVIVENTVEDILQQCRPYVNEIVNEKLLTTKLITFISSMDFYFYEMYLAIIEILTEFGTLPTNMSAWKHILEFLIHKMTVRRRARPTQDEIEMQANGGILPNIAKYRFSFQVIIKNDLHETLGEEVYVDNCEDWFTLIKIHTMYFYSINSEEELVKIMEKFCMTAVKNSLQEYKAQTEKDECGVWQLKPTDNSLLKSTLKLTKFMVSKWKIFALLYYVMNYTIEGVDQVEAAYECYKYALENEEELVNCDKSVNHVLKVKQKYIRLKIQHLLHVHKLNEENLLKL